MQPGGNSSHANCKTKRKGEIPPSYPRLITGPAGGAKPNQFARAVQPKLHFQNAEEEEQKMGL